MTPTTPALQREEGGGAGMMHGRGPLLCSVEAGHLIGVGG